MYLFSINYTCIIGIFGKQFLDSERSEQQKNYVLFSIDIFSGSRIAPIYI